MSELSSIEDNKSIGSDKYNIGDNIDCVTRQIITEMDQLCILNAGSIKNRQPFYDINQELDKLSEFRFAPYKQHIICKFHSCCKPAEYGQSSISTKEYCDDHAPLSYTKVIYEKCSILNCDNIANHGIAHLHTNQYCEDHSPKHYTKFINYQSTYRLLSLSDLPESTYPPDSRILIDLHDLPDSRDLSNQSITSQPNEQHPTEQHPTEQHPTEQHPTDSLIGLNSSTEESRSELSDKPDTDAPNTDAPNTGISDMELLNKMEINTEKNSAVESVSRNLPRKKPPTRLTPQIHAINYAQYCATPGCASKPTHGPKETLKVSHCSYHAPALYVRVKVRKCANNLCNNTSKFLSSVDNRRYCQYHIDKDQIKEKLIQICQYKNCCKSAIYHAPSNSRSEFCSSHKPKGYISKHVNSFCAEQKCYKYASYGYTDTKKRTHCVAHKKPDQVNIDIYTRMPLKSITRCVVCNSTIRTKVCKDCCTQHYDEYSENYHYASAHIGNLLTAENINYTKFIKLTKYHEKERKDFIIEVDGKGLIVVDIDQNTIPNSRLARVKFMHLRARANFENIVLIWCCIMPNDSKEMLLTKFADLIKKVKSVYTIIKTTEEKLGTCMEFVGYPGYDKVQLLSLKIANMQ